MFRSMSCILQREFSLLLSVGWAIWKENNQALDLISLRKDESWISSTYLITSSNTSIYFAEILFKRMFY